jgi:hypothetical protein
MKDEGMDVETGSVGRLIVCDPCYRTYLQVTNRWINDGPKKQENYEV